MHNVPIDPVNNAAETAPTRFLSIFVNAGRSNFSFLAPAEIFGNSFLISANAIENRFSFYEEKIYKYSKHSP